MIYLDQKPIVLSISLFENNDEHEPRIIPAEIKLTGWEIDKEDKSECVLRHPEVNFRFEEDFCVYGYILTDQTGRHWYIEKFPSGPFTWPGPGTISITPKLNLPKLPEGLFVVSPEGVEPSLPV